MTRAEQIAAVLAEHRRMGYSCSCAGWNGDLTAKDMRPLWDQHQIHVAAALDAALAQESEPLAEFVQAARRVNAQRTISHAEEPDHPVFAAQEGERGGAEVAAAVEAVAQGWDALREQMDAAGLPVVAAELRACASDIRAALADPAGALAKHDAEVLRVAAEGALEHFGTFGGAGWAHWLRERADRIEAQP